MSIKLNEVQQRLSEIDATRFHKMVDVYLSKKYNYQIHSTGTKTGEDKPRKGTPDTLITLDNGNYIFVEYTAQKTKIKDKFLDDIEKCLDSKKTGIKKSKIEKIILACNSSLQSNDIEELQNGCQGIVCEVITNSTLSYDLVNHYPTVAKDFLGIDIGNVLTANFLKEKYLNDFKTISLLLNNTPKPIDEIFVNLAIIKDKKEEKQNKEYKREALLSSYEEIHKPKEPIEIKELINTSKKSLIYGKAGVGKTTLCKYIAYKWANEEFYNEFEYLIYISLREWKTKGLKGAIKDNYYSQDDEDITLNIKENSQKILFLFDGYDELVEEKKRDLQKEIEVYSLTHYIITSRPYGYQRNDFRVDEHFETIGFTDEDIAQYIENFFDEVEKQQALKEFLKSNIGIKHIAYIPLMLEMICSLWVEESFSDSLTMTELYSQVVENILKKHSHDERVYDWENREEIKELLGKIAFEALTNQSILFDGKLIRDTIGKDKLSFFKESIVNSGFLKSDRKDKSVLGNNFEFPHLTFQEYFSALYVAELYKKKKGKKKVKKIIKKWKFYPHMQMFFAFLGGLIDDKEFLLGEIESEPRDLVGFYELGLHVDCLYQIKKNELSLNYIENFNIQLENWLFIMIESDGNYEPIINSFYMFIHILKDRVINRVLKVSIESENQYLQKYLVYSFDSLTIQNKKYKNILEEYKNKIDYTESKVAELENNIVIDKTLNELDFIFLNNYMTISILEYTDSSMYVNRKSQLEIENILKRNEIFDTNKWFKENKEYILNSDFAVICNIDIKYFIENSKNNFMKESLRKEYEKITYILTFTLDIAIIKILEIIKDENFNWFIKHELIFLLHNLLENDIKLIDIMLDLWLNIELEDEITLNALNFIDLKSYDNLIIDKLFTHYQNEKNNFSNKKIEFLSSCLAEVSSYNFYASLKIIEMFQNNLDKEDLIFYDSYIDNIKINILFKIYDEGWLMAYPIFRNCTNNNLPLYLKNNKLHTIENGKEISTKKEIDEKILAEIQTLISPTRTHP